MDQSQSVQELSARIDRLERQNRRLFFALLGVAALGIGLVVGGVKADTREITVEASRFVLKDSAGEVKGQFLIGRDGGGAIILYGPDRRPVTQLPLQPGVFPLGQ